jgi:Stress responsive A/B Barrel Domain
MEKQTRRAFVAGALVAGATAAATALPINMDDKKLLAHHVFFWLRNPESKEDLKKLLDDLKTLAKIETVRGLHIGIPASTEKREVVDNSYSASELIFFDDVAGQNTYQQHPIHLKFVEDCSSLWKKVIVYDAMDL